MDQITVTSLQSVNKTLHLRKINPCEKEQRGSQLVPQSDAGVRMDLPFRYPELQKRLRVSESSQGVNHEL
jgi:hypothetical protein